MVSQDTGISVRKRVIKIFRDVCLDQPDFPRIPDMCVKMIRRVNDEEGIKVCFYNSVGLYLNILCWLPTDSIAPSMGFLYVFIVMDSI